MDRKRFWPFGNKAEQKPDLRGLNRFFDAMKATRLPHEARFRAMVGLGTIGTLVDEERLGFGKSEIDFVGGLDPVSISANGLLLVDSKAIAKLRDIELDDAAREILGYFEMLDGFASEYQLDWKPIEADKIGKFLIEASSAGGEDYESIQV